MPHFTRPQNTAIPGEHLVTCAICPNRWLRSQMRFMVIQVPGWPQSRALVCPRCYDPPNPRADRPRPRPVKPPDIIQDPGYSNPTEVLSPTLTSLTPATGSVALFTGTPTIVLTGTHFTAKAVARIGTDPNQKMRTTSYTNSTSLTMTLRTADIAAGTYNIDAFLVPPPTPADGVRASNILQLVITP